MGYIVKRSEIHGVGVFAMKNTRKGFVIGRMKGTTLGHLSTFPNGLPLVAAIDNYGNVVVPIEGYPLWFTNYSCKPNIEIHYPLVFAARDIKAGDELTVSTHGAFGDECGCPAKEHLAASQLR
jgi:SET domain-containing protein